MPPRNVTWKLLFAPPEACKVRTLKIGAGTWKRDFQAAWGCGAFDVSTTDAMSDVSDC